MLAGKVDGVSADDQPWRRAAQPFLFAASRYSGQKKRFFVMAITSRARRPR
jgi:hypothetical protein